MCKLLFFILGINLYGIITHYEPFTGSRPAGMGNAFLAIVDDANAISYNPGGLADLKYSQILGMYSPSYTPGFLQGYLSIIYPVARFNVVSADWAHIGFMDPEIGPYGLPELQYTEGRVNIGYGTKIFSENFSFGIGLKVFYTATILDGETEGTATGYSLNFGLLYHLLENLRFGIVANNIFPSASNLRNWGLFLKYDDGTETLKYPPSIRIGVAYSPIKYLNIAMDLIDPLCFGAEYWLFNIIGLRAGIKNYFSGNNLHFSFGSSIRYWLGQIDYAISLGTGKIPTHNISLSFLWGYHAYLIDVVRVDIEEIFPSLYKSYAEGNAIKLVLKNKSKEVLDTKVGFFVDRIMKAPTEKKVKLLPNVLTEINLPAVFSEDITTVKDDGATLGKIILSYKVEDKESKDISSHKFTLYSRNAFKWDVPEKLACFVTPHSEKIKEFTRLVLQATKAEFPTGNEIISKNFYRAMLLFSGLGAYGVSYVPDPTNPFGAREKAAVDYIQYPDETLRLKTGDCDDCVVLYASCLESIGIPTILIDSPGHIFLMFDSGLTIEEAAKLFPDTESYIQLGEKVFVPVETTMFGKEFFEAIYEGSRTFKNLIVSLSQEGISQQEVMNLINTGMGWEKYPSAIIKMPKWELGKLDANKLNTIIKKDAVLYISRKAGTYFTTPFNKLKADPNNPNLNNTVGIYFAYFGVFTFAEEYLKKAISLNPNWAAPYSNLGNLYLLIGDYEKAKDQYEKALKLSPNDIDIIENLKKIPK